MRLIEADALEKAIYKWMPKDQSTWLDSDLPPIENLIVSIMMTIQEQPVIDAVPVEWITRYMNHTDITSAVRIRVMLDVWREEHETD